MYDMLWHTSVHLGVREGGVPSPHLLYTVSLPILNEKTHRAYTVPCLCVDPLHGMAGRYDVFSVYDSMFMFKSLIICKICGTLLCICV